MQTFLNKLTFISGLLNSLTTWPLLLLLHFTGAERVTMDTTTWLYAAAVIGCMFGECF